jgi:hypothetical protein
VGRGCPRMGSREIYRSIYPVRVEVVAEKHEELVVGEVPIVTNFAEHIRKPNSKWNSPKKDIKKSYKKD